MTFYNRYREVCKNDFNDPGFDVKTGHFTQLVWKRSTKLGIGFARGSYTFSGKRFDNCLFVVARYKERGNVEGAFAQNVEKGIFRYQDLCGENIITLARKRSKLVNLKRMKNAYEKKFSLQLVL